MIRIEWMSLARWLALLSWLYTAGTALGREFLLPRHEVQGRATSAEPARLYSIEAATLHRDGDFASVEVWVDRKPGIIGRPPSQRATYDIDCRQRVFRPHSLLSFDAHGQFAHTQPGAVSYTGLVAGSVHEVIAQIACAPSLDEPAIARLFERVEVPDRRDFALTRLGLEIAPKAALPPVESPMPDEHALSLPPAAPTPESAVERAAVREVTLSELTAIAASSMYAAGATRVRTQGRLVIPTINGFIVGSRNACWLFERPNQAGGTHVQLEFEEGSGPNTMRRLPALFEASDLKVTTGDGHTLGNGAFVVVEGTLSGGRTPSIHVTSIRRASPTGVHGPAPITFEPARRSEQYGQFVAVSGRLDYTQFASLGDSIYEFSLRNASFGSRRLLKVRLNVGSAANQVERIPHLGGYFESWLRIRDRRGAEVPHDVQLRLTGVLEATGEADDSLGRLYVESIEAVAPRPARRMERPPVIRRATRETETRPRPPARPR